MTARPVFVVGSPRSGTTMIGNYIGSSKSVLNAGEYRALYLAYGALPSQLSGGLTGLVPTEWEPHRARYIKEEQRHSVEFIIGVAEQEGRRWFCDSFPRNLFIAEQLEELFPEALFVLCLRHYTGTIQSLLRLGTITVLPGREAAIDWVNPTAVAAGALWSRHYVAAMGLPNERTILFGYDRFCADPATTLERLKSDLAGADFPVDQLDDDVFTVSHGAPHGQPQLTVGSKQDGRLRLAPRPSYDASTWTPACEADVHPAVAATDALLSAVFPGVYSSPVGYPGAEALLAAAAASS